MSEKIDCFFETDKAKKTALIGVIAHFVAFFAYAKLTYNISFAYVNLVDFEETDGLSNWFSTLLFVFTAFWIVFSVKAKCKPALVIIAVTMLLTSVIFFGIGLFQPCFYTPLALISTAFGGSILEGGEAFFGVDGSMWAIFAISLELLDKAAHICLGIAAIKCFSLTEEDTTVDTQEESEDGTKVLTFAKILMYLGIALVVLLAIVSIIQCFSI